MPRQIRNENAQILTSKATRQVRHDLLVSRQSVKQHNVTAHIIIALVNYIGNQPATPGADHHRSLPIRRGPRERKAPHAKHKAKSGPRTLSPFHRAASRAARRNTRA
jgi:hypothetical protein